MRSYKFTLANAGRRDVFEKVLADAEAKVGGKLYARFEGDEVNGHATAHGDELEVVLYDNADKPDKDNKNTFKAKAEKPTHAELAQAIGAEVVA